MLELNPATNWPPLRQALKSAKVGEVARSGTGERPLGLLGDHPRRCIRHRGNSRGTKAMDGVAPSRRQPPSGDLRDITRVA